MKARQLLPAVVVSAVVSASVGFGLSQASQPETAKAGGGAKIQKQILAVQKQSLSELDDLNRAIGTPYGGYKDVTYLLQEIQMGTEETCKTLGGSSFLCQ